MSIALSEGRIGIDSEINGEEWGWHKEGGGGGARGAHTAPPPGSLTQRNVIEGGARTKGTYGSNAILSWHLALGKCYRPRATRGGREYTLRVVESLRGRRLSWGGEGVR